MGIIKRATKLHIIIENMTGGQLLESEKSAFYILFNHIPKKYQEFFILWITHGLKLLRFRIRPVQLAEAIAESNIYKHVLKTRAGTREYITRCFLRANEVFEKLNSDLCSNKNIAYWQILSEIFKVFNRTSSPGLKKDSKNCGGFARGTN